MNLANNNFQKISKLWIFTDPIVLMLLLFFGAMYFLYLADKMPQGLLFFFVLLAFLITILRFLLRLLIWFNFSFSVEDGFLLVRENVLRKKERRIPYNLIENVSIEKFFLQMIFGLRSLKIFCSPKIEDFYVLNPVSAKNIKKDDFKKLFLLEATLHTQYTKCFLNIGSCGRYIIIPGLTKRGAETLKKKIETLTSTNKT
ncbi:MAG: PH domain-containing protein [Candidatus Pacebacteria bacterium]|nr:PH domain-containing protein [Candidatus Paceibacterota bacterium]NUQ56892.1 PH domain-containing protein [Candidatus Paceibacter sp.]